MTVTLSELRSFLETPVAQAVLWVAVTSVIVCVAYFGLARWRDGAQSEESASDHLANFRELHDRGVLSPDEFRTIKSVLRGRLQRELSRDDENS